MDGEGGREGRGRGRRGGSIGTLTQGSAAMGSGLHFVTVDKPLPYVGLSFHRWTTEEVD